MLLFIWTHITLFYVLAEIIGMYTIFNTLSVNPTKWSSTSKQVVDW